MDRLLEVIGNVEEVKNLMKRVPPLEAKNGAMDKMIKGMQKKMDVMGNIVNNTKNAVKKLAEKSCSILKTIMENFKNLLDKLEQGRI